MPLYFDLAFIDNNHLLKTILKWGALAINAHICADLEMNKFKIDLTRNLKLYIKKNIKIIIANPKI